jgi:hypothetical protein
MISITRDKIERMRILKEEWVKTPCEKCGAKVGELCKTSTGNPVDQAHLYRNRRARYSLAKRNQEQKKSI